MRVKFNPKNVYGEEPCCCQRGKKTTFLASTLYCLWCNATKARVRKKINSFCKANGWDKTCRTCKGEKEYYIFIGRTDSPKYLKKQQTKKEKLERRA